MMHASFGWFVGPSWGGLVEALLHSLWIASVFAWLLALLLRWMRRPEFRYAACLACLAAVFVSTLAVWTLIDHRGGHFNQAPLRGGDEAASRMAEPGNPFSGPVRVNEEKAVAPLPSQGWESSEAVRWFGRCFGVAKPWIALVWFCGALGMLVRCGVQLAGADRLRRSCRPMNDPALDRMLEQAKAALLVTQRVELVICDFLTSPCVIGWLVPCLVFPASLLSTLSPEQIRLILLHELAHIRRGDYFVNLFQMLMESLFFFNPPVWWISRQARHERECSCDEMAVMAGGSRTEYARALVVVAESALELPAGAAGFGDKREPRSLTDRIEHLLSPGWNRHLKLGWRAGLGSLLSAGLLLALVGVGTRVTVGAILTPEQRMDRIGKLLVEHGESLLPDDPERVESLKCRVSGVVKTADGLPPAGHVQLTLVSSSHNRSGVYSMTLNQDGTFSAPAEVGRVWICAASPGYAPAVVPVPGLVTNEVRQGIVVELNKGRELELRLSDTGTGQPVVDARVFVQFWIAGSSTTPFPILELPANAQGLARLSNVAELPVQLTLDSPEHERQEMRLQKLPVDGVLSVRMRKGLPLGGVVMDKESGRPISGAEVMLLSEAGSGNSSFQWDTPSARLAVTDGSGRFQSRKLKSGVGTFIGVRSPGREAVILGPVFGPQTNLVARLGAELVVRGRVVGDLGALEGNGDERYIRWSVQENEQSRNSFIARVSEVSGSAQFVFTNRVAGLVKISVGDKNFERLVDGPVTNWVIEVPSKSPVTVAADSAVRTVIIRLLNPGGVLPRGNVEVTAAQTKSAPFTYARKQMPLEQGECRLEVPVGTFVEVAPAKTTLGFWFEGRTEPNVTSGGTPLVMEFQALPAGVITASARMSDGEPAADLSFSILVVKPSPRMKNPGANLDRGDSWSANDGPRKFISSPLPLGGAYQVIAWKKNGFALSEVVSLTESNPDRSVELRFSPPVEIHGFVAGPDGVPIAGLSVVPQWEVEGRGFQLKEVFTEESGRFSLEGATRSGGAYLLDLIPATKFQSQRVKVDLDHLPLRIQLKPGLSFAGKLIQTGSHHILPKARLRLVDATGRHPGVQGMADDNGEFAFSNLADTDYYLGIEGASVVKPNAQFVRPNSGQVRVFECQLWQGSELVPVASSR